MLRKPNEQAEGALAWYEKDWLLAVQHLQAMLEAGCKAYSQDEREYCFHCGQDWLNGVESHKPDCAYVSAKEFFGSPDAPQAPKT
jgi:hypothetical protein